MQLRHQTIDAIPTPRATISLRPRSQPAPSVPPLNCLATLLPPVPSGLSQAAPADDSPRAALPLHNDDKLWTNTFQTGLGTADSGPTIDFGLVKADESPIPPIDVGNASSIGTKCPIIHSDDTTFTGRVGGALSHEYAGLTERQVIPEVSLGAQLEHQLNNRSKVLGGFEYAQDVTEPNRFRVRTRAAWELFLDPEKNLSLRTGVLESRNALPQGERVKNLDYNLDVIWKF
jgi:hypothetical protein